jgi:hypothetical protein
MSPIPANESKTQRVHLRKTAPTNEVDHSAAELRPIIGALEGKATFIGEIVPSQLPDDEWDRLSDESWARVMGENFG